MREDQKCRKEGIAYETNVGLKTLTETVRDNCTDSYPFSEEDIRASLPSFTRTEIEVCNTIRNKAVVSRHVAFTSFTCSLTIRHVYI